MKNKKVDFRTSSYFPMGVNLFGILIALTGLALIFSPQLIIAIICRVSGITILTTNYRLEIDFEKKLYRDYVWFLGTKNGKAERFENIEYLFVKQSKSSQRMNSLVTSKTFTKDVFDGYLKFSEQKKTHLLTKENKASLIKKLRPIADALGVKIVDYTTGNAVV
jgi:hypothetical protein